jgi:hypothetical protein
MKIKRPGNEQEETNRSVGIVKGDSKNCNNNFNFRDASFFVSPTRHVEAQDMSGT